MIRYYAQLNDENICIGLSQLSGTVNHSNMIKISEELYGQGSLLGCLFENGEWVEVPKEETEPIRSIEARLAEMEELQLIQMMAQAEVYEQQQEETLILYSALTELAELILMGGNE